MYFQAGKRTFGWKKERMTRRALAGSACGRPYGFNDRLQGVLKHRKCGVEIESA